MALFPIRVVKRRSYRRGVWQSLWKFDFHPVPILDLIMITQPDIRGDLDNVARVMSDPLFVLIGTQEERPPVEYSAWNDVD